MDFVVGGGLDLETIDNDEDTQPSSPRRIYKPRYAGPYFASLYGMDQQQVCSGSTEKCCRAVWKRWKAYQSQVNPNTEPWVEGFGLQLYPNRSNINDAEEYNRETVDGFFYYLSNSNVGTTVMKKAKTFLNIHLKCEHYCRLRAAGLYPTLVDVKVGMGKSVQQSVSAVSAKAASACLDRCEDIQADLEQLVPNSKLREMILFALRPIHNGAVAKLELVNRVYFVCHYNTLMATTRRGEELYGQRLIQRSTTELGEIGAHGITASQLITNKAKHNKQGWIEQTTMLPHMDPTRDASAWHGLLWLWRMLVENEVFPSFLEEGDEAYARIWSIWSYPSNSNRNNHIDSSKFGENFTSFFTDAQVVCAKKTHQPRFQAIQEMDRMGIPESLQLRMSGHKGKEATVHQKSYAHNPPTKCLLQRAGGDPDNQRHFNPVHFVTTAMEEEWCNELIRALVPGLMHDYEVLIDRYSSITSDLQRRQKRLYTLVGVLRSMLNDIRQFILMIAAPLVDPDHFQLLDDTRSIWQIYHNDAFAVLLNLPAFRSNTFSQLEHSILSKMKSRANFSSILSVEAKCEVERMVVEKVTRPLLEMHQQNRTMMTQMHQQHQLQLQSLIAMKHEAVQTVTPAKSPRPPSGNLESDDDGSSFSTCGFLADGRTHRKRRSPVKQAQAISNQWKLRDSNSVTVPAEPLHILCDKYCFTLEDYWKTYQSKWKPLEIRTNGEWRKDLPGTRGRSAWWTQRAAMFRLIEYYMESQSCTEQQAIAEADKIFTSVPVGKTNNKRPIKDLNKAFKKQLEHLGIHRKGRPPSSKRRRTNNAANSSSTDPFADAFPMDHSLTQEAIYASVVEQDIAASESAKQVRAEAERSRQQQKIQAQWDCVHRYSVGPTPPLPPNYGTVHALPFRPYQNQPEIPLPPGHQYAALPPNII